MNQQTSSLLRRVLYATLVFASFGCVALFVLAVFDAQKTGLLKIATSDDSALITISQEGHQAAIVGRGNGNVRVTPGAYHIMAVAGAKQSDTVVTIGKKQTKDVSLTLTDKPKLPSVSSINFQNTDTLVDAGLTTDQVLVIKTALFNFKPAADNITVDPASVSPGPLDHSSDNPVTTLNFNLNIDTTSYKAVATYNDLVSVQLKLYDTSGNQVFDSSAAKAPVNANSSELGE